MLRIFLPAANLPAGRELQTARPAGLSRAPVDGAGLGARNSIQFAGAGASTCDCDRATRVIPTPGSRRPPFCGGPFEAAHEPPRGFLNAFGRASFGMPPLGDQPSHDPVGHAAEGLPRLTLTHALTSLKSSRRPTSARTSLREFGRISASLPSVEPDRRGSEWSRSAMKGVRL